MSLLLWPVIGIRDINCGVEPNSGRAWEMFPCAATVRLKSEHMADSGHTWETFPCAVAEHPGLYFNNLEGVFIIQLVST